MGWEIPGHPTLCMKHWYMYIILDKKISVLFVRKCGLKRCLTRVNQRRVCQLGGGAACTLHVCLMASAHAQGEACQNLMLVSSCQFVISQSQSTIKALAATKRCDLLTKAPTLPPPASQNLIQPIQPVVTRTLPEDQMGTRAYPHHLYLQGNRCRGRKAEAWPYTFHKTLRCGIIEHRDRPHGAKN